MVVLHSLTLDPGFRPKNTFNLPFDGDLEADLFSLSDIDLLGGKLNICFVFAHRDLDNASRLGGITRLTQCFMPVAMPRRMTDCSSYAQYRHHGDGEQEARFHHGYYLISGVRRGRPAA